MDLKIREDALKIIDGVIEVLETKESNDIHKLKELSDHTIHNASIFQDECSVSLAVLVYALSKIMGNYDPESPEYKVILNLFILEKKHLKNNDETSFHEILKKIFGIISKIDNKIDLYVQEVISQAQIKKGSRLCEHGLSCAKSAEVLGISQWDLMDYLGKTKIVDYAPGIDIKSRMKFARRLFS